MNAPKVAYWAHCARAATRQRDRAIREMRESGALLKDIAAAAGLTVPGVRKITIRRATPTPKGI